MCTPKIDPEQDQAEEVYVQNRNRPESAAWIGEIVLNFPAGEVTSWDILMKWVYHGSIPELKINTSDGGTWTWDPFDLYVLVDEFNIPELKDRVISALQAGQAVYKIWHSN